MRPTSLAIVLLASAACRPPETGGPPAGAPPSPDSTPTFLAGASEPGAGEGSGPASGEKVEEGGRKEPPWLSKGTVTVSSTLEVTGPASGTCCGSAGNEVDGAPLRFWLAPADPGQRDGWALILGKDDKAALLGMADRGAYSKELWRGTAAVTRAGEQVTLVVPAEVLPKVALRLWPGSPGTVKVGDIAVDQDEQGTAIPYVVVLPPGTSAPATTAPAGEATPGGDPSIEPPSGEEAGALEKTGGKGPAGEPGVAPGGKPGEAPPAGSKDPAGSKAETKDAGATKGGQSGG